MLFPRHLLDSLLHSLFSQIPLLSEASLGYPVEDDTPLDFYSRLSYTNFLLAFVTIMTINSVSILCFSHSKKSSMKVETFGSILFGAISQCPDQCLAQSGPSELPERPGGGTLWHGSPPCEPNGTPLCISSLITFSHLIPIICLCRC